MTNLGRIENEPASVYHGDHDKPAFGSSAIKLWITDPQQFYNIHVAKTQPKPDFDAAAVGNAYEDRLLYDLANYIDAGVATRKSKAVAELTAANPDKVVLTTPECALVEEMYATAWEDAALRELISTGKKQVTYRIDRGPFYIQARLDLENTSENVPEWVCNELEIPSHTLHTLITDIKTTASLVGKYGFERTAMYKFFYPVQAALYQLIVENVTGVDSNRLPFIFHACAKDGTGAQWYDFPDYYNKARNHALRAIGDLQVRFENDEWSEFRAKKISKPVPENYLDWAGE